MASNRKYATLPDLDSAPDVYETPDLADDLSTLQTTATVRSRSSSSSSSYKDVDDDTNDAAPANSGHISHQHLRPSQARSHFSSARVDAQGVDFSDRISSRRRSYKTSSRRRRRRRRAGEGGEEELGDFSDEDDEDYDDEGLQRKIARLRREVEEVKSEVGRRRQEKEEKAGRAGEGDNSDEDVDEGGMVALGRELARLHAAEDGVPMSAGARLVKHLNKKPGSVAIPAEPPAIDSELIRKAELYPTPSNLTEAASFDTRLTLLERALGITSSAHLVEINPPRPMLVTIERLHEEIMTLTESTPAGLDALARHVKQLTLEAEKLEEARSAFEAPSISRRGTLIANRITAAAAAGMPNPSSSSSAAPPLPAAEAEAASASSLDEATLSKINALYSVLPSIERLSPLLTPVLDRLRSLHVIHNDAGRASDALDELEARQEFAEREIARWREGVEDMHGVMRKNEETMRGNVEVIEEWVGGLEERVRKLRGGE